MYDKKRYKNAGFFHKIALFIDFEYKNPAFCNAGRYSESFVNEFSRFVFFVYR